MGVYRYQITHVDYWRGSPHRWNNTLHYDVSSDASAGACIPDLFAKITAMGTSAKAGGIAEIKCYNVATGGVPVSSVVYFDWTTPSSWISYTDTSWTGTYLPQNGEQAAKFRTQAGYSRTGKPVFVGIYFHNFKADAVEQSSPNFASGTVTALAAKYNALQTLSVAGTATAVQVTPSGGSIAGSGTLEPYITPHQRVRGRRASRAAVTRDIAYYGLAPTVNTGAGGVKVTGPIQLD